MKVAQSKSQKTFSSRNTYKMRFPLMVALFSIFLVFRKIVFRIFPRNIFLLLGESENSTKQTILLTISKKRDCSKLIGRSICWLVHPTTVNQCVTRPKNLNETSSGTFSGTKFSPRPVPRLFRYQILSETFFFTKFSPRPVPRLFSLPNSL